MSIFRRHLLPAALGAIVFSTSVSCSHAASAAKPAKPVSGPAQNLWTLRDFFRRDWHNELVTYNVSAKTAANKKQALLDSAGGSHTYQWIGDGAQNKIAFMADVPPDGSASYRLAPGAPRTDTDLKIEETDADIRLSNGSTDIDIRKQMQDGQGPIAAVKLNSGKWIGDSMRTGTPALTGYTAQVTQNGPVLGEIVCEAKFEGGKNWRLLFRLLAGEPAVTVSEVSTVGPGASWQLRLDKGFAPTHIFRRNPLAKKILTEPIPAVDGEIAQLEPWLEWWQVKRGTWFSLFNEADNDMLSMEATDPALWVDLGKYAAGVKQAAPRIPITVQGGGIYANFDLTGGVRHFMISATDKTTSLQLLGGKDIAEGVATPAHKLVIKYSDFPLDRVKDYVLQWPETAQHPRMLMMKDDVARLKAALKVDAATLAANQGKLSQYTVINALPVFLVTGDEKVGKAIAAGALEMMQTETDSLIMQDNRGGLGAWPHNQQGINPTLNIVDVAWPAFTAEERIRVRAQAALIGYTVNSPNYWSVERGFHANPNMTTMVASYQAGVGSLLADHPESDKWIASGTAEARNQIENWSDANGGWLEAPHYATVSYDNLLGMFLMMRGKDGGAALYSDKMKKVATFFAKIATPPDIHIGNIRHQPRIGNTWLDEPTGIFGHLAALWKDRDPVFASEMQWMYLQQGSWPNDGIGGRYPTFEGVDRAFLDPNIKPVKPAYTSTLFPSTGVSLRNAVDDRETQLYLIAGNNHQHYDDDSGSITIWAKGRIVANDFAYAESAASLHSLIEGGGRAGLMHVTDFTSLANFDSVRGLAGNWQRQIAFVKDADVMAPNYFVLRDSTGTTAAATWHLWLDGNIEIATPVANVTGTVPTVQTAQITGRDDIDTDIFFVSRGGVKLDSSRHTSKLFGVDETKVAGANRSYSLNGLNAHLAAGQDLLTLIYPRLKTTAPPKITVLADGRALKIENEAGTDYVFLADKSFAFDEGDIHFEGTSGLVKIRGDKVAVSLGEPGKLTARGITAIANVPPVAPHP